MATNKISLIKVQDGAFFISDKLSKEFLEGKKLNADFASDLVLRKDDELASMKVFVKFMHNDEKVMEYGVLTVFTVKGLSDIFSLSNEELKKNDSLIKVTGTTIGFLRGALYKQLKGTILESIFLPLINTEQFLEHTEINKL